MTPLSTANAQAFRLCQRPCNSPRQASFVHAFPHLAVRRSGRPHADIVRCSGRRNDGRKGEKQQRGGLGGHSGALPTRPRPRLSLMQTSQPGSSGMAGGGEELRGPCHEETRGRPQLRRWPIAWGRFRAWSRWARWLGRDLIDAGIKKASEYKSSRRRIASLSGRYHAAPSQFTGGLEAGETAACRMCSTAALASTKLLRHRSRARSATRTLARSRDLRA